MTSEFAGESPISNLESRLLVRPIHGDDEARQCATIMSTSEPWVTLGRTFEDSLRIVSNPGREVYGGFVDGELVAFLILAMQGAFVGYIQTVAVRHDWRSRNVGREMIDHAERRIFRESPNVFLCVSSFNPRARQLYERLGYSLVGELTDYIVRGHSELLMRKTIGPLRDFVPKGSGQ
ncbi:MAG TPA: GNAT family N-acetyltransferase [Gemmatimonadaceae bacterium]|nr:GNAT family N-acetyltransferase [Gemmatimonadaceae bacterium]